MVRFIFLTALSDKVAKDFITPLVVNKKLLRDYGFEVEIRYKLEPSLLDCDTLCIISSYVRLNQKDRNKIELLKECAQKAERCYFFDVSDSTGDFYWDFLKLSERYYKKQLLRDRGLYFAKWHKYKYVFDYYSKNFDFEKDPFDLGANISRPEDAEKLRLSWNVGLGDYFRYPKILRLFIHQVPFYFFDPEKKHFQDVSKERNIDVMGCFSLYEKSEKTIHFHRKRTLKVLEDLSGSVKSLHGFIQSDRYYQNLKNSKLVVCPFGFGEISWKDYESFINGAVVIKPDMSFMETWPHYYQEDKTYVPYRWDFEDLAERIQGLLDDEKKRLRIARGGQEFYRNTINQTGKKNFL